MSDDETSELWRSRKPWLNLAIGLGLLTIGLAWVGWEWWMQI